VIVVAAMFVAACGKAPPPPKAVTNEALAIRLASVPSEFTVSSNQGKDLELVPASESTDGRLWFAVGPEDRALNLVAAVKAHQHQIEEMPGADYKGGQELETPHGTAFYSRGQYLAGTAETEETAVFIQHPTENRLLTIAYRYPVGVDSSVRVEQLLSVLDQRSSPLSRTWV